MAIRRGSDETYRHARIHMALGRPRKSGTPDGDGHCRRDEEAVNTGTTKGESRPAPDLVNRDFSARVSASCAGGRHHPGGPGTRERQRCTNPSDHPNHAPAPTVFIVPSRTTCTMVVSGIFQAGAQLGTGISSSFA